MSPEDSVKLANRISLILGGILCTVLIFLAFNRIDVGPSFTTALTLIFLVILIFGMHVVGKIFNIKYLVLRPSPAFSTDTWKKASWQGKLLLLLIIPEVIFFAWSAITNTQVPSLLLRILIFLELTHFFLINSVFGKTIKQANRELYGKEEGDRLYAAQQKQIHSIFRTFQPLYDWSFFLGINGLEFVFGVVILAQLVPTFNKNQLISIVVFLIAVQDMIILFFLSKRKKAH